MVMVWRVMFDSSEATVVIVDDDPGVRASLQALFESVPYRCVSYASAEEYLTHSAPPGPSCLLLDLRLPGMNGLELQRLISRDRPRLPVIFVSGDATRADMDAAMAGGAVDFFRKPAAPEALLKTTRQCLCESLDAG